MPDTANQRGTGQVTPGRWIERCLGSRQEDWRNQRRFLAWLFAWAVAFTVAALALRGRFGVPLEGAAAWVVAVGPSALALGALRAYWRFLSEADELVRQIQVEGLALGFGVGLVFCMAYHLLELAGAGRVEPVEVGTVLLLGMAIGQLRGAWRYR